MTTKHLSRMILGAGLLMAMASPGLAETRVRGLVRGPDGPLAGATLRLLAVENAEELRFGEAPVLELARARSGEGGYFELAAPSPGIYRLAIEAQGFLGTVRLEPLLWSANANLAPIELKPARRARLAVVDEQGRPVAGTRVRVDIDPPPWRAADLYPIWPELAETARDGSLELLLPAGQNVRVTLAAPGFPVQTAILAAGLDVYRIALASGPALELEVRDARGRLQPGVVVYPSGFSLALGRSDREGRLRVHALPGVQTLAFDHPEAGQALLALDGPWPTGGRARIGLTEVPKLRGRVVGLPSRAGLEEPWVLLLGNPLEFARGDGDGRFTLSWLPGRRLVRAVKGGYVPALAELSENAAELVIALEPAARLEGRVVDGAGIGVGGARVYMSPDRRLTAVEPTSALTDPTGSFELAEAPTGAPLEVFAELVPRTSAVAAVAALAAGERAWLELRLPGPTAFECRVVDQDGGGIAGAELFAVPVDSGHWRLLPAESIRWPGFDRGRAPAGKADDDGRIKVEHLPPGLFDLGARAPGFVPGVLAGLRLGGEDHPETVEIRLNRAVAIRGKVVDARGRPVEGARISWSFSDVPEVLSVEGDGWEEPVAAVADDRGEFRLDEIPAGRHLSLRARKPGHLPASLPDLVPGVQEEVVLRLGKGGRVEGRVTALGEPTPRLRVELEAARSRLLGLEPSAFRRQRLVTDPEGRFAFADLPSGEYRLKVEGPAGFQTHHGQPFGLGAEERKSFEIALEQGVVVFGRVLLPNGEPVPGAEVSLGDGDEAAASARTDSLGRYRMENARPGPATLRVESDDRRPTDRQVSLDQAANEIDVVVEQGSFELEARVVDAEGAPVAGAVVKVGIPNESIEHRLLTPADGSVRLRDLEAAPDYYVDIEKEGYLFETIFFELERSLRGVEWRLVEAGARIAGDLLGLDAASRGQVEVSAFGFGGGVEGLVEGSGFQIEGLTAGIWEIEAELPGTGTWLIQPVEIAEGQEELRVDLDFGRLAGTWVGLFRQNGVPVAVEFMLTNERDLTFASGFVPVGRLELNLLPGVYQLYVTSEHGKKTVELRAGPPGEHIIDLDAP